MQAETRTCVLTLDPRGFVHAIVRDGFDMDEADAANNVKAIAGLGAGRRSRVFVDLRGIRSQTRGARQYFAGPEAARATLAVALLIGSPVSRVLGNFFLRFGPHRVPTALFTDERAAIAWLFEQAE